MRVGRTKILTRVRPKPFYDEVDEDTRRKALERRRRVLIVMLTRKIVRKMLLESPKIVFSGAALASRYGDL